MLLSIRLFSLGLTSRPCISQREIQHNTARSKSFCEIRPKSNCAQCSVCEIDEVRDLLCPTRTAALPDRQDPRNWAVYHWCPPYQLGNRNLLRFAVSWECCHDCALQQLNLLFSPTVVVIFPGGIALYFLLNFVLHCSKYVCNTNIWRKTVKPGGGAMVFSPWQRVTHRLPSVVQSQDQNEVLVLLEHVFPGTCQ